MIELRYGFADGSPRTLEEVGRRFSVTRERARQIEAKALTKLRHPCVPKELRVGDHRSDRLTPKRRRPPPAWSARQVVARPPAHLDDLGRARPTPTPGRRRAPAGTRNTMSTPAHPRLDDDRRHARRARRRADLLGDLADDGGRRLLAPLEQPAGQAPARPVGEPHEQHAGRRARRCPWRRRCATASPSRTRPPPQPPGQPCPHPEQQPLALKRTSGVPRAPRRAAPAWPPRSACDGRRGRARRGRRRRRRRPRRRPRCTRAARRGSPTAPWALARAVDVARRRCRRRPRTGRGRTRRGRGTASSRASRGGMPDSATSDCRSSVRPDGAIGSPSHAGALAPDRVEARAVGQVHDERGERAVGVDRAQAGGEPRDAAAGVRRAVERVEHDGDLAVGLVAPGLLRQHADAGVEQQLAPPTSSAARSLRYCPGRVPARPQSSRSPSVAATAAATSSSSCSASASVHREDDRTVGPWPPSTSPASSPTSRTTPPTTASTSTTSGTSSRPTRCARPGRSTCTPRRRARDRSTCTSPSRSTPASCSPSRTSCRDLDEDDEPPDEFHFPLVFTWGLPPLPHAPDLLVLATELAGVGGTELPARGVGHRLVHVGHRRRRAHPHHPRPHPGVAGPASSRTHEELCEVLDRCREVSLWLVERVTGLARRGAVALAAALLVGACSGGRRRTRGAGERRSRRRGRDRVDASPSSRSTANQSTSPAPTRRCGSTPTAVGAHEGATPSAALWRSAVTARSSPAVEESTLIGCTGTPEVVDRAFGELRLEARPSGPSPMARWRSRGGGVEATFIVARPAVPDPRRPRAPRRRRLPGRVRTGTKAAPPCSGRVAAGPANRGASPASPPPRARACRRRSPARATTSSCHRPYRPRHRSADEVGEVAVDLELDDLPDGGRARRATSTSSVVSSSPTTPPVPSWVGRSTCPATEPSTSR